MMNTKILFFIKKRVNVVARCQSSQMKSINKLYLAPIEYSIKIIIIANCIKLESDFFGLKKRVSTCALWPDDDDEVEDGALVPFDFLGLSGLLGWGMAMVNSGINCTPLPADSPLSSLEQSPTLG